MKATTGSVELIEFLSELRPELEKLSDKFSELVSKGDYVKRIVEQELSDEDDQIADPSGRNTGVRSCCEIDLESEEKRLNLCLRMITTFDIVDKNIEVDEVDDGGR